MSKLLLYYGLFAIGAVSFLSFADAEISVYQGNLTEAEQKVLDELNQYKLTAEVEVYSGNVTTLMKHPVESKECKYHPEYDPVFTDCRFWGPGITTGNQPEQPKNGTSSDDVITSSGEGGVDGLGVSDSLTTKVTRFEQIKEKIEIKCNAGKCAPSEEKLRKELENIKFCFEGDRNSVGIQTEGTFEDPVDLIPTDTDNFDLDSNTWLKEVFLNNERCIADDIVDTVVHSVAHKNKSIIPWNDKSNLIPEWIANITSTNTVDYSPITEEERTAYDERIKDTICNNTYFGVDYKEKFDCPEEEKEDQSDEYSGISSPLNPTPQTTENPIWLDYLKLRSGDDSDQLKKNIKVNEQRESEVRKNYGGQQ